MFEKLVAAFFAKYFGEYFENFDEKQAKISLWNGEVHLSGLRICKEALSSMETTLCVAEGTVEEFVLKVPWTRLRSESAVATITGVRILLKQKTTVGYDIRTTRAEALKRKTTQLAQADKALLRGWFTGKGGDTEEDTASKARSGFFARLGATVLSKMMMKLQNVCVQYAGVDEAEVDASSFNCGTWQGPTSNGTLLSCHLEEFSAFACDSSFNSVSVEAGRKVLHKQVVIKGLRLSMDSCLVASPNLSSVSPARIHALPAKTESHNIVGPFGATVKFQYQPVTYDRSIPTFVTNIDVGPMLLRINSNIIRTAVALSQEFRHGTVMQVRQLQRPRPPRDRPKDAPGEWWGYAITVVIAELRERRLLPPPVFSWEACARMKSRRRKYVALYSRSRLVELGVLNILEPLSDKETRFLAAEEEALPFDVVCAMRRVALDEFTAKVAKVDKQFLSHSSGSGGSGGGDRVSASGAIDNIVENVFVIPMTALQVLGELEEEYPETQEDVKNVTELLQTTQWTPDQHRLIAKEFGMTDEETSRYLQAVEKSTVKHQENEETPTHARVLFHMASFGVELSVSSEKNAADAASEVVTAVVHMDSLLAGHEVNGPRTHRWVALCGYGVECGGTRVVRVDAPTTVAATMIPRGELVKGFMKSLLPPDVKCGASIALIESVVHEQWNALFFSLRSDTAGTAALSAPQPGAAPRRRRLISDAELILEPVDVLLDIPMLKSVSDMVVLQLTALRETYDAMSNGNCTTAQPRPATSLRILPFALDSAESMWAHSIEMDKAAMALSASEEHEASNRQCRASTLVRMAESTLTSDVLAWKVTLQQVSLRVAVAEGLEVARTTLDAVRISNDVANDELQAQRILQRHSASVTSERAVGCELSEDDENCWMTQSHMTVGEASIDCTYSVPLPTTTAAATTERQWHPILHPVSLQATVKRHQLPRYELLLPRTAITLRTDAASVHWSLSRWRLSVVNRCLTTAINYYAMTRRMLSLRCRGQPFSMDSRQSFWFTLPAITIKEAHMLRSEGSDDMSRNCSSGEQRMLRLRHGSLTVFNAMSPSFPETHVELVKNHFHVVRQSGGRAASPDDGGGGLVPRVDLFIENGGMSHLESDDRAGVAEACRYLREVARFPPITDNIVILKAYAEAWLSARSSSAPPSVTAVDDEETTMRVRVVAAVQTIEGASHSTPCHHVVLECESEEQARALECLLPQLGSTFHAFTSSERLVAMHRDSVHPLLREQPQSHLTVEFGDCDVRFIDDVEEASAKSGSLLMSVLSMSPFSVEYVQYLQKTKFACTVGKQVFLRSRDAEGEDQAFLHIHDAASKEVDSENVIPCLSAAVVFHNQPGPLVSRKESDINVSKAPTLVTEMNVCSALVEALELMWDLTRIVANYEYSETIKTCMPWRSSESFSRLSTDYATQLLQETNSAEGNWQTRMSLTLGGLCVSLSYPRDTTETSLVEAVRHRANQKAIGVTSTAVSLLWSQSMYSKKFNCELQEPQFQSITFEDSALEADSQYRCIMAPYGPHIGSECALLSVHFSAHERPSWMSVSDYVRCDTDGKICGYLFNRVLLLKLSRTYVCYHHMQLLSLIELVTNGLAARCMHIPNRPAFVHRCLDTATPLSPLDFPDWCRMRTSVTMSDVVVWLPVVSSTAIIPTDAGVSDSALSPHLCLCGVDAKYSSSLSLDVENAGAPSITMSIDVHAASLRSVSYSSCQAMTNGASPHAGGPESSHSLLADDLAIHYHSATPLQCSSSLTRTCSTEVCIGNHRNTPDARHVVFWGTAAQYAQIIRCLYENYMKRAWRPGFLASPEHVDSSEMCGESHQPDDELEHWRVTVPHLCVAVRGVSTNAVVVSKLLIERSRCVAGLHGSDQRRQLNISLDSLRLWSLSHVAEISNDGSYASLCAFAQQPNVTCCEGYAYVRLRSGSVRHSEAISEFGQRNEVLTDVQVGELGVVLAPRFVGEAVHLFSERELQDSTALFADPAMADQSSLPPIHCSVSTKVLIERVNASLFPIVIKKNELVPLVKLGVEGVSWDVRHIASDSECGNEHTIVVRQLSDSAVLTSRGGRTAKEEEAAFRKLLIIAPSRQPTTEVFSDAFIAEESRNGIQDVEAIRREANAMAALHCTATGNISFTVKPLWFIAPPLSTLATLRSLLNECTLPSMAQAATLFSESSSEMVREPKSCSTQRSPSSQYGGDVHACFPDIALILVDDEVLLATEEGVSDGVVLSLGRVMYSSLFSPMTQSSFDDNNKQPRRRQEVSFSAISLRPSATAGGYLFEPLCIVASRCVAASPAGVGQLELSVGTLRADVSLQDYERLLHGVARSLAHVRAVGIVATAQVEAAHDVHSHLYDVADLLGNSDVDAAVQRSPTADAAEPGIRATLGGVSLRVCEGGGSGLAVTMEMGQMQLRRTVTRTFLHPEERGVYSGPSDVLSAPVPEVRRGLDGASRFVVVKEQTLAVLPHLRVGMEWGAEILSLVPLINKPVTVEDIFSSVSAPVDSLEDQASYRATRTNNADEIAIKVGTLTIRLDFTALVAVVTLLYRPYAHIILPQYVECEIKRIDQDITLSADLHLSQQVKILVSGVTRNHITMNAAGHSIFFHDCGSPLIRLEDCVTFRIINARLHLYDLEMDHYISSGSGAQVFAEATMNTRVEVRTVGSSRVRHQRAAMDSASELSNTTRLMSEQRPLRRTVKASAQIEVALPGIPDSAHSGSSLLLHAALDGALTTTSRNGATASPDAHDVYAVKCELSDCGVRRHHRRIGDDRQQEEVTDLMSRWGCTFAFRDETVSCNSDARTTPRRTVEVLATSGADLHLRYSDLQLCVSAIQHTRGTLLDARGALQPTAWPRSRSADEKLLATGTLPFQQMHLSVSVEYVNIHLIYDRSGAQLPLFLIQLHNIQAPGPTRAADDNDGTYSVSTILSAKCDDLQSTSWVQILEKMRVEAEWTVSDRVGGVPIQAFVKFDSMRVCIFPAVVKNVRRLLRFTDALSYTQSDSKSAAVDGATSGKLHCTHVIQQYLCGAVQVSFADDGQNRFPASRTLLYHEEMAFNFPSVGGAALPRSQHCVMVQYRDNASVMVNVAAHGRLRIPLGPGLIGYHGVVEVGLEAGRKFIRLRTNVTLTNTLPFTVTLAGGVGDLHLQETLYLPVEHLRNPMSFSPVVRLPCGECSLGVCYDSLVLLAMRTHLCVCPILTFDDQHDAVRQGRQGKVLSKASEFEIREGAQDAVYALLRVDTGAAGDSPDRNSPGILDLVPSDAECRATLEAPLSIVNRIGVPIHIAALSRRVIKGEKLGLFDVSPDKYIYEQISEANVGAEDTYGVTEVDPFQDIFIDISLSQVTGSTIGRRVNSPCQPHPAWVYCPYKKENCSRAVQVEDLRTGSTLFVCLDYAANQVTLCCAFWFLNETPFPLQITDINPQRHERGRLIPLIAGLCQQPESCLHPTRDGTPLVFSPAPTRKDDDEVRVWIRLRSNDGDSTTLSAWTRWSDALTISSITETGVVVCPLPSGSMVRTVSFSSEVGVKESGGATVVTFRPRWVVANLTGHQLHVSQKSLAAPLLLTPPMAAKTCIAVDRVVGDRVDGKPATDTTASAVAIQVCFGDECGQVQQGAWSRAVGICSEGQTYICACYMKRVQKSSRDLSLPSSAERVLLQEEVVVLGVTTFLRASVMYVVVARADPPPYVIENRTEFPVCLKHQGASRVVEVPPKTSKAYTWEEPRGRPRMELWVGNGSQSQGHQISASTIVIDCDPLSCLRRGDRYLQMMELSSLKQRLVVQLRRVQGNCSAVCISHEREHLTQRAVECTPLRCRLNIGNVFVLFSDSQDSDVTLVSIRNLSAQYVQLAGNEPGRGADGSSQIALSSVSSGVTRKLEVLLSALQVTDERKGAKEKVVAYLTGSGNSFVSAEFLTTQSTSIVYLPFIGVRLAPIVLHAEDSFIFDLLAYRQRLAKVWAARNDTMKQTTSHSDSNRRDIAIQVLEVSPNQCFLLTDDVIDSLGLGTTSVVASLSRRTVYILRLCIEKVELTLSLYRSPGGPKDPLHERFGAMSLLVRSVRDVSLNWPSLERKNVSAPAWIVGRDYVNVYWERLQDQLPSVIRAGGIDTIRNFMTGLIGMDLPATRDAPPLQTNASQRLYRRPDARFTRDSVDEQLSLAQTNYISVCALGTTNASVSSPSEKRGVVPPSHSVITPDGVSLPYSTVVESRPWDVFVSVSTGEQIQLYGKFALVRAARVSPFTPVISLNSDAIRSDEVLRRTKAKVSLVMASARQRQLGGGALCTRCRELNNIRFERFQSGAKNPLPHPSEGTISWEEFAHHISWDEFVSMCSSYEVKRYATLVKDSIIGVSKNVVIMKV